MARQRVVVVGGGPAGLVAARHAALGGACTLLVEARAEDDPGPSPCTGLISPRTLSLLEVSERCVVRQIRGGALHSPRGEVVTLRSRQVKGLVVERPLLEAELRALARRDGAELRFGARALRWRPGSIVIGEGVHERVEEAGVVIGADGSLRSLSRSFPLPAPARILSAMQAITEGDRDPPDEVDVFLGMKTSPGFFAWAVPAAEGSLRVGVAAWHGVEVRPLLQALLDRRRVRAKAVVAGLIPLGAPGQTTAEGVLVVGDAAGQVKPLSGGGLYPGAICARIAGETAARAVRQGETGAQALADYERRWRREIGEELRVGFAARTLAAGLSDEDLDAAVSALAASPELTALLAEEGDIDHPTAVASLILGRRDLAASLLAVTAPLWASLRSEATHL